MTGWLVGWLSNPLNFVEIAFPLARRGPAFDPVAHT